MCTFDDVTGDAAPAADAKTVRLHARPARKGSPRRASRREGRAIAPRRASRRAREAATLQSTSFDARTRAARPSSATQVDYEALPTTVGEGSTILLDDGLIALRVTEVGTSSVKTVAENTGPIKPRKGVNLPGSILDLPALTPKDKEDLKWSVESGADFVALSFVRSAANVRSCRAWLERCQA